MATDIPSLIPGRPLPGHTSAVLSCAVARDGRTAVTTSLDRTALVWNTATGRLSRALHGHTERVFDCSISADAARIVTSSHDGTVRFWDMENGQCVSVLRSSDATLQRAYGCWLSDDGRMVYAVFGAPGLRRAELVRCEWTTQGVTRVGGHVFQHAVRSIAVAANILAFTTCDERDGSRSAHIVELGGYAERRRIALMNVAGGFNAGVCIAGEEGTVVVADNRALRLLHPRDEGRGDVVLPYYSPGKCHTPCLINAKGTRVVASNADNSFSVWDVGSRRIVAVLDGPSAPQYCCAMSADERRIVVGRHFGAVKVYDVEVLLEGDKAVKDAKFARDWFNTRAVLTMSLEQAMTELNNVFEQINLERVDDAMLTMAIDSVLNDADVFVSEFQFLEVFRFLRRHIVDFEDINKAREQWTATFHKVAGCSEDATLQINLSAWRFIRRIHNETSKESTMSKDTAIKLLRLFAKQNAQTVTLDEFLEVAHKADRRWGMPLHEIENIIAKTEAERRGEEEECAIDLAVIEEGQRVVRLPCMHCFHADCMLPFLKREQNPFCPIDRSPVPREYVPLLPVWTWRIP